MTYQAYTLQLYCNSAMAYKVHTISTRDKSVGWKIYDS